MIHSTLYDSGRNTKFLSFCAFERSIEAGLDPPGNRSKLPVWTDAEWTYHIISK